MADIEDVRVGDTLRVDLVVTEVEIHDPDQPVRARPPRSKPTQGSWIRADIVEAAEHIPAPKVFQRRDVVRTLYPPDRRGGLVVGPVEDRQFWVWVTWPGNEYSAPIAMPASGLEHDEAPE